VNGVARAHLAATLRTRRVQPASGSNRAAEAGLPPLPLRPHPTTLRPVQAPLGRRAYGRRTPARAGGLARCLRIDRQSSLGSATSRVYGVKSHRTPAGAGGGSKGALPPRGEAVRLDGPAVCSRRSSFGQELERAQVVHYRAGPLGPFAPSARASRRHGRVSLGLGERVGVPSDGSAAGSRSAGT
jgi:hypothetical protein